MDATSSSSPAACLRWHPVTLERYIASNSERNELVEKREVSLSELESEGPVCEAEHVAIDLSLGDLVSFCCSGFRLSSRLVCVR